MSQEVGNVIAGKYRLNRRIARGGMGAVWVARHLELDIDIALKFLRSEDEADFEAEARFRREARATAAVVSPHVVGIQDFGVDAGVPYLAMELLQGEDLECLLQRSGPLPLRDAISLIVQASKGLRAAHQAGLVHRDVKPSNLFVADVDGERVVKVLDFGIVKGQVSDDGQTTTQGLVFGSPAYMSPEQARGARVDSRSDLWSLAGVFYKMLTGVAPFDGENASDIVVKLCTEDPAPPSRFSDGLSSNIDRFFEKAFQRNPERRFQTAMDFAAACQQLLAGNEALHKSPAAQSAGRRDETASLPTFSSRADLVATDTPRVSLRPSLVPERKQQSTARGVFAVAGLLFMLGGMGLLWSRPAASLKKDAIDHSKPKEAPIQTLRPISKGGTDAEKAEANVPPKRPPLKRSSDDVSEKPPPEGSAQPQTTSEASRETAGAALRRPPPSPSRFPPVEKRPDPVFGLPVDAP